MDSSVPAMNWELLEQQLQLAAEEERNRQEVGNSLCSLLSCRVVCRIVSCRVELHVRCRISCRVLPWPCTTASVCLISASLRLLATTCSGKFMMWIRK